MLVTPRPPKLHRAKKTSRSAHEFPPTPPKKHFHHKRPGEMSENGKESSRFRNFRKIRSVSQVGWMSSAAPSALVFPSVEERGLIFPR